MVEDLLRSLKRVRDEIDMIVSGRIDARELIEERNGGFEAPLADIEDFGKEVVIRFDLPGVRKEDIELDIDENFIEVKAKKQKESEKEDTDFYISERIYRGFFRRLMLPVQIVPEKANARFRNGVLEIIAPKAKIEKSVLEIDE